MEEGREEQPVSAAAFRSVEPEFIFLHESLE
jgi:hypothetical protein